VRARGIAVNLHPAEAGRPGRPGRRLRRRQRRRDGERARGRALQPVGPKPDDRPRELRDVQRRAGHAAAHEASLLLAEGDPMTPMTTRALLALPVLTLGGLVLAQSRGALPRHDAPPSPSGNLTVALCDGETVAEVPGVKEGETPTPAQAHAGAARWVDEWRRKHPDGGWAGDRVARARAP